MSVHLLDQLHCCLSRPHDNLLLSKRERRKEKEGDCLHSFLLPFVSIQKAGQNSTLQTGLVEFLPFPISNSESGTLAVWESQQDRIGFANSFKAFSPTKPVSHF